MLVGKWEIAPNKRCVSGSIVFSAAGTYEMEEKQTDGTGVSVKGEYNLDTGMSPENFLEKAVLEEPDTLLIVDAADFGGDPGEARVFCREEIAGGGLSTHALSLQMTCEYLETRIPVRVFLLAIQPANTALGEEMSRVVSNSIDKLAEHLVGLLLI